jgi:hypothetical protein
VPERDGGADARYRELGVEVIAADGEGDDAELHAGDSMIS